MNTNSRTKKNRTVLLLLALLALAPFHCATAQSDDDNEFGAWATIEASKKINKKLKLDFEAEFRSIEGLSDVDRVSAGVGASYKLTSWLKASAGYIFIYSHSLDQKKTKWEDALDVPGYGTYYDYNLDHDYWTERHRFHFSFTGEYKIGRVELSLRERVQYTRTNSATTDETKYRWQQNFDDNYNEIAPTLQSETSPELKDAKENTTLRSRLGMKWDIPKCKVNPFASIELYTRLDKWKGCDKLRYRIGADYKINKDNKISLFYLYQDANDDDEPKGHAVGVGYSIDL